MATINEVIPTVSDCIISGKDMDSIKMHFSMVEESIESIREIFSRYGIKLETFMDAPAPEKVSVSAND